MYMKKLINYYWPFEFLNGFFGNSGFIMQSGNEKINEEVDKFTIEISLPGFKKEDISLKVSDGFLEIHGSCSRWDKVDYNKRYSLPPEIDDTRIEAKMEDGVLIISLPKKKSEDGGEKIIEIQ